MAKHSGGVSRLTDFSTRTKLLRARRRPDRTGDVDYARHLRRKALREAEALEKHPDRSRRPFAAPMFALADEFAAMLTGIATIIRACIIRERRAAAWQLPLEVARESETDPDPPIPIAVRLTHQLATAPC